MTIAPPALVTGAARVPLPYGLFAAFAMRGAAGRWETGVQWALGTCAPVDGIGTYDCGDPVQSVVKTAGAGTTSGTFTLTYPGVGATSALAWNAAPAAVQAALVALGLEVTVTAQTNGWLVQFLNIDTPTMMTATDTFNTGDVAITAGTTADGTTIGLPKNLTKNTPAAGRAAPFTVYGHFRCSPVGYSPESAQVRATEHLLAREEARVEQAFWTGDLGNFPKLQDPATVSLGAVLEYALGLAQLEAEIANDYGSLGVIHMTRAAASVGLARDLLVANGARLTTRLGTPVVAGSGYPGTGPTGQAPAAGQTWLFASPALFGHRSEVFTSSNRPGDLFVRGTNDLTAVAERSYLLGFDPCGVTAALVSLLDPSTP